jgi:hypothetical protein
MRTKKHKRAGLSVKSLKVRTMMTALRTLNFYCVNWWLIMDIYLKPVIKQSDKSFEFVSVTRHIFGNWAQTFLYSNLRNVLLRKTNLFSDLKSYERLGALPTCNPGGIDMLEVTGSNPGPGKINLIKLKKHQQDS